MKVLRELDVNTLTYAYAVGCPFSTAYGGTVPCGRSRDLKEYLCQGRCGRVFPESYVPNRCPCWYIDETVVKNIFWRALHKSREVDCYA